MTDVTTREALIELMREEPGLSAAAMARRLGVSRERIRQLAQALGLTLPRYGRTGHKASERPPRPVVRIGGVAADISYVAAGAIGELLAAADLTARGWTVFYPITRIATCDLVVVDIEGRVERIEVRCGARLQSGRVSFNRPARGRADRIAVVVTGEPVIFLPPYEGDTSDERRRPGRPRRRSEREPRADDDRAREAP